MAFSQRRSVQLISVPPSRRVLAKGTALLGVLAASTWADVGQAAVVFNNGFESGNTRDWDYRLNPEGLSAVTAPEPVLAGTYALRAELTAEREWENGIFRTEVQHKPATERVAEGAETYFAWSIYLPKALPAGDYQLGYFETSTTYQQVFSLHAEGSDLALYINTSSPDSPSSHPGLLTVGQWHRIVYHVKWSADRNVGFVSLWWDGVKVVDQMSGKTYLDDPALVQLGLLKNPPEPPEAIVLYVDEVMEGDSYADVSLGIPEGGAGAPVPTASDTSSLVAPPPTTDTTAPSTTTPPVASTTAPTPAPAASNAEGGCSVDPVKGANGLAWTALVGLAAWLGRRTRRAR
jgi:Polysaccharide lyase